MRRIASLCFVGFHISEGVPENVLELGLCNVTKGTNTTPRLVTTWAGYHPKSFYMMQVSLWVRREVLPQVGEFKYLGVSFTIGAQIEREIDRRIGAPSAVMPTLNQSVAAKRELSLLICQSVYLPALTCGQEL